MKPISFDEEPHEDLSETIIGEATLAEKVTLFTKAPWNVSPARGIWLRTVRAVRSRIFGADETDKWMDQTYRISLWFDYNYGSDAKTVSLGRRR